MAKYRFIAKNGENQSSDFCITRSNRRNARFGGEFESVCVHFCVCGGAGDAVKRKMEKKKKTSNKQ